MRVITDGSGRTFTTLRVSLLSRCNLGCVYCTQYEEGENGHATEQLLTTGDMLALIARLHSSLSLRTVRLTGGEPLLYHELVEVIEGLRDMGIPHITLTTNGWLLQRMAHACTQAGLAAVNISLDAVNEEVFMKMSRRSQVQKVLNGIDAAIDAGLEVKLNTVVMKGINESEILPLLSLAAEKKIVIRFLELMSMGYLHHQSARWFFSQHEMLEMISANHPVKRLPRRPGDTANYWQTSGGNVFGIIANETEPFCHDCNRLRLDSAGNIFGCLSSNTPVSLLDIKTDQDLEQRLRTALGQKQALRFTGSALSMLQIGG